MTGRAATLFIDGDWRAAATSDSFASIDPATGEHLGEVSAGTVRDVETAVGVARAAFAERRWMRLPYPERARVMFEIADRIDAELADLAVNEVRENGMPLPVARATISSGAQAFRYFGGWIGKIHGQTGEMAQGDAFHAYTLKEPVGVAALIVPWNGPFMLACHKLAPALAAGCTTVLKPAEDTSLNTLNLARIAREAGVPSGVVNLVTGLGSEVGQALAEHADVDKVSFTGSTATGRRLIHASAGNLKRLSLELGGKSPVIVMDDADLDVAVPAVLSGIMQNSGQACIAGSRLYVQRGICDELIQGVANAASRMVIGNGLDDGTELGPVISQQRLESILECIERGVMDGAELVTGGARHGDTGFFVQPTVLWNVPVHAAAMREEIFGPVLSAVPFDDLEWAISEANRSRYGLAGSVYTTSLTTAHTVAKAVRAGTFWINSHRPTDLWMPFGGYKESGWGREGGAQGLDGFMETKSVVARLW